MEKYETQHADICVEKGVLYVTLKPGAQVDLKEALAITGYIEDQIGGQRYPVVADIREIDAFNGEARDVISKFGDEHLAEAAFIVKGEISRLVANIMIKLTHPRSELREFNDPAEAAKWIQQFAVKDAVNS